MLTEFLDREVEKFKNYRAHDIIVRDLRPFDQEKVRQALRQRLSSDLESAVHGMLLDVLGFLGDDSDLPSLPDGSGDTAVLLAAVVSVDVGAPVVDLADLKEKCRRQLAWAPFAAVLFDERQDSGAFVVGDGKIRSLLEAVEY